MRIKKREMTGREAIDQFIESCSTVRLGLLSQGVPYVVPVNFVHLQGTVFFHSACTGRKYMSIQEGGSICLEFDKTFGFDRQGADTFYASVIGWGKPRICSSREEKVMILQEICTKYLGEKRDISDTMANGTCIVAVKLDQVTGKENRG